MLREYPTIMIKIDRFLGQFSAVLCTALHQWVEVSYVTKWFHHQQNIFYLRIITMIWPNHKNHNSNFLDSSLIAVLKISCKNVTCSVISTWRSHVPTKREMEKIIDSEVPPFGEDMWSFPGGFLWLVLVGVSRMIRERDGITWEPAYNHRQKIHFSGEKKTPSTHCVDLCQLWTLKLLIISWLNH